MDSQDSPGLTKRDRKASEMHLKRLTEGRSWLPIVLLTIILRAHETHVCARKHTHITSSDKDHHASPLWPSSFCYFVTLCSACGISLDGRRKPVLYPAVFRTPRLESRGQGPPSWHPYNRGQNKFWKPYFSELSPRILAPCFQVPFLLDRSAGL